MPDEYQIIERAPTLEEYRQITFAVSWEPYTNFAAVEKALQNSLYNVVVVWRGETVGMGRIVGDGAMFYYLQDIAVTPEHRGKGIGTRITRHLLDYIKATAPDNVFVSLFSTLDGMNIYEKQGFEVSPDLVGMVQRLGK